MSTSENPTELSSNSSSSKPIKIPSKVKNLAFILAFIGVLPLFACSLGIATHVNQSPLLLKILLAYTALFVSFLCGLHWGVAICQDIKFPKLSRTLIIEGFIFALGVLGVYLFVKIIWLQICIFSGLLVLIWLFDLMIGIKKMIPLWAVGLRTLYTVIIVALLAVAYLQEMPKHEAQIKKETSLKPVASQVVTIPNK